MKYMIDKHDTLAVISLQERSLDTRIASSLKSEFVMLNSEGISNIVLDLTETQYADSSGLSALLAGNRMCNANDGVFILCGISESVKKLIEIAQLHTVLNIAATREEASELIKNYELEMQLNQDGALKDEAAWSSSANALPILTAAGIHDKDVQAKDSTIDIKAVGSDLDLEEADWDEDDWDEDTDDIGDEEWNEEDEADGDWDEDDWDEDDFDAAYVEDFDDDDV